MTHKPLIHLVLVAALLITAPMSLAQSNIKSYKRTGRLPRSGVSLYLGRSSGVTLGRPESKRTLHPEPPPPQPTLSSAFGIPEQYPSPPSPLKYG
jgi:hypothetical protein